MDELKAAVKNFLAEQEFEAEQWKLGRDDLPFPDFRDDMTLEEAWASGLSEGKAQGAVSALKEVLRLL